MFFVVVYKVFVVVTTLSSNTFVVVYKVFVVVTSSYNSE